ncbi:hypothetical protein LCGC14_0323140 [marine sediment metagenome]|uniref:Uncharacterized protein n=1 Tax=marine sediment metagenome TaxID=412755 RepID=A0A0F9TIK3_9ZZZZ
MSDTSLKWIQGDEPAVPAKCGCELRGLAVVLCPLHAAAPDLLAACEDADIWFDQNMACETSASFQRLRHKFTAAIAKAKGETNAS